MATNNSEANNDCQQPLTLYRLGWDSEKVDRQKAQEWCYGAVGEGWRPLILSILDMLDTYCAEIQISDIKEKYGGLDFSIQAPVIREELRSRVNFDRLLSLIEGVQMVSHYICECCGRLGKNRKDLGWIKTLCDECHLIEKYTRSKY